MYCRFDDGEKVVLQFSCEEVLSEFVSYVPTLARHSRGLGAGLLGVGELLDSRKRTNLPDHYEEVCETYLTVEELARAFESAVRVANYWRIKSGCQDHILARQDCNR